MAHITADRVRDTSTTTGTGAFAVSGTAPTGYRTFSAVLATNDTCWYAIQHQTAAEWEVGLGTYSSANTITRTTVLASSNSGNAVSFSAGTKDVFITLPASKTLQQDNTGAVVISANSSSDALRITQTGTGNALEVEDTTNPDATPFVVDAIGRVFIGYTTSAGATSTSLTPNTQIVGTGTTSGDANNASSFAVYRFFNDVSGPTQFFFKSRSSTPGVFSPVASGDTVGNILFQADDGTSFPRAASISAAVDGTPGTNDMPGRLVFSTTADGASTPTERMRIDKDGHVGIGSTAIVSTMLRLGANVSGGTTMHGVFNAGVVQSDVTASMTFYNTSAATQAASFTLSSLVHYGSSQGTFGASSFVTNQYGYAANSTLVGAANNYGFYGNIAAGTSRNITTVERTSNVVTITTSVAHGYLAGQSVTVAAVTNTSLNGTFTITDVPTTTTFTYAQTAADIPSGADTGTTVVVGRYNFYANGTAPNFFGGATTVSTSSTDAALRVTQTGSGNALLVEDSANPDSTPFSVNASGIVKIGSLNSVPSGIQYDLQMAKDNAIQGITVAGYTASTSNPVFAFFKSRSTSVGTAGIVSSSDTIGSLQFRGDDGVTSVAGAAVLAQVDAAPAANSMPGRLVFQTTPDGSNTLATRMTINNQGNISVNTSVSNSIRFRVSNSPTQITANTTTITADGTHTLNADNALSFSAVDAQGNINQAGFNATISIASGGSARGVLARSYVSGASGTVTAATGTYADVRNTGAGTLTNAAGFTASFVNSGGGTLTNTFGFYGPNITAGTNNYSFYSAMNSAANAWAFYGSGTAQSYFGGNVLIGYATQHPFAPSFQVVGNGGPAHTLVQRSQTSENPIVDYKLKSNGTAAAPTAVSASDSLWRTDIRGYDGTNWLQAAGIDVAIDGTPGTNDMPGRIVFSTTLDGASTPTERMRITSAGNVGIGTSGPTAKLDVVGGSTVLIQATDGTVAQYVGYPASSIAYTGTGSNHPFALLTNNQERLRVLADGTVGINTSAAGGFNGTVSLGGSGSPTSGYLEGFSNQQSIPSSVTARFDGFFSVPSTAAASFTVGELNHFRAQGTTKGAGSAISSQIGFHAASGLTGGTYNFGFFSDIASGAGRYNFYAQGTADNYFAGNVGIGTTSPSSYAPFTVAKGTAYVDANIAKIGDSVMGRYLRIHNVTGGGNTRTALSAHYDGSDSNTFDLLLNPAGGNVGIGTSSPSTALDVNGLITTTNAYGGFSALQAAGGTGYRWVLNNDGTFRLQYTTNGYSSASTPILVNSSGNVGIGTTAFGSGAVVIGIANATTVPSTNPSGGGVLYVEGGALKYRGSSGTVTTIANA